MAHILTLDSSEIGSQGYLTINGTQVWKYGDSTIQTFDIKTGDVIKINSYGFYIEGWGNGDPYLHETLNITAGDLKIITLDYSPGWNIGTINYTETPSVSVDLATAFPDKWAALAPGEHTIQIRAKNPGNYLDSDLSTAITFVKVVNWSINITAANCTADASNPTVVPSNTTAENPVILKFNKVAGYTLPTSVVLDGIADDGYTWAVSSDGTVGTITIVAPTGNITGTVNAVREVYSITTNLTNALAGSGNPTTIGYGLSATLTFTFPTGYEAPTSVTVEPSTVNKSWEAGTGTLTLTNATGPVTVTVVGVATTTTLDGGTYKWHDSINLSEWSQEINFTSNGASYSGMRYTGNGTAMTLQYMDADAEWQTVYNYDEDASTGSWVNPAWQIVDLGTSAQTVTAIFKADFVANTTKLTQLATPQNVTADGTTVSWDAVENATSYAVLADGVSIGEYTPVSGFSVTITGDLEYTYIKVYDIEGGTLLYTFDNSDKSHTFTGVTSLFIDAGSAARVITSVTTTAGITSNRTTGRFYDVTITAEADGTVTIVQEND